MLLLRKTDFPKGCRLLLFFHPQHEAEMSCPAPGTSSAALGEAVGLGHVERAQHQLS